MTMVNGLPVETLEEMLAFGYATNSVFCETWDEPTYAFSKPCSHVHPSK